MKKCIFLLCVMLGLSASSFGTTYNLARVEYSIPFCEQSGSGAVSVSCSTPYYGSATAAASSTGFSFHASAASSGDARGISTSQLNDSVTLSGTYGSGFLDLTFLMNSSITGNGNYTSTQFAVSPGPCSGNGNQTGCSYGIYAPLWNPVAGSTDLIGTARIPVWFGSAFTIGYVLNAQASGSSAVDTSVTLTSLRLYDSSGELLTNAQVTSRDGYNYPASPSSVPEPSTITLVGAGFVAPFLRRFKR